MRDLVPLFLILFVVIVAIFLFFVPEFALFSDQVILFIEIHVFIKIFLLGMVLFFVDKLEFIL